MPQTLPQLSQPGLPGAYSVELVSPTLVSPPNSNLTQLLLQATWCLFLGRLLTTVDAVCFLLFILVFFFLVSFQIYPHRFPGAAGVNPAQVATRTVASQGVKSV